MSKNLVSVGEVVQHFGKLAGHKDTQVKFRYAYTTDPATNKAHYVPFPVYLKANKAVSDTDYYAALTTLGYDRKDIQINGLFLVFNKKFTQRFSATKSKNPTPQFRNEIMAELAKNPTELVKMIQNNTLESAITKRWADKPADVTELDIEVSEDIAKELKKLCDAEIENLY